MTYIREQHTERFRTLYPSAVSRSTVLFAGNTMPSKPASTSLHSFDLSIFERIHPKSSLVAGSASFAL